MAVANPLPIQMNESRRPTFMRRLALVILLSLLGVVAFAVTYPIVAGATGGALSGY